MTGERRVPRRTASSPALLLLAAALSLAGCRGLAPLPPPQPAAAATAGTAAELWRALAAGNPVPAARESAFRSTSRMVLGDLATKKRAQRQATACVAHPPPGFESIAGVATGGAAADPTAPLFAYLHTGDPAKPWVIVLHGLYDSKNAEYIRRVAEWLAAEGYGVLVPDLRWHGCLLAEEWLPGLGTAEAADLLSWGRWLAAKGSPTSGPQASNQGRPVGLLGFSLGGLDVIHALAQPESAEVFRAGAIAISPPAALARTLGALDERTYAADRGLLRLIDRGFRRFMEIRLRDQKIAIPPNLADKPFAAMLQHVLAMRFGPLGVGPEMLFATTDPAARLRAAKRPLLVLTTSNDALFGAVAAADLTAAGAGNPWVKVIETPFGGHIGQPGLYPQWTANLIDRFFRLSPGVATP